MSQNFWVAHNTAVYGWQKCPACKQLGNSSIKYSWVTFNPWLRQTPYNLDIDSLNIVILLYIFRMAGKYWATVNRLLDKPALQALDLTLSPFTSMTWCLNLEDRVVDIFSTVPEPSVQREVSVPAASCLGSELPHDPFVTSEVYLTVGTGSSKWLFCSYLLDPHKAGKVHGCLISQDRHDDTVNSHWVSSGISLFFQREQVSYWPPENIFRGGGK